MRKMICFTIAVLILVCIFSGCAPAAGDATPEPSVALTPNPAPSALPSEPIAEASLAPFTVDISDIHVTIQGDEQDGVYHEFQLSYGTQVKQFEGTHMVWWDPPKIYTLDLNGDQIKEIVVVLAAGNGTGCLIEELHIFDAITLREYDCTNAFDIITDTLNFFSDAENYYIQSPSNLFTVPKSTLHAEQDQLLDSIGIGEYITFSVDSDNLFCTLGCQATLSSFCGDLSIRLGLDHDGICCLAYDYRAEE